MTSDEYREIAKALRTIGRPLFYVLIGGGQMVLAVLALWRNPENVTGIILLSLLGLAYISFGCAVGLVAKVAEHMAKWAEERETKG